jgi:sulfide dehydrogenase cytochrome subunit
VRNAHQNAVASSERRRNVRTPVRRYLGGFAIAAGLVAGVAFAQNGENSEGALLASVCTTCHGVDGRGQGAIPQIGGLPADQIADALLAFRDGTRQATVMGWVAKSYSDAQIQMIADYFSQR